MAVTIPARTAGNCEATLFNVAAPCHRAAPDGKRVCMRCEIAIVRGMNNSLPLKLYLEING